MTKPLWTIADLAQASGGVLDRGQTTDGLAGVPPAAGWGLPRIHAEQGGAITGISIDTRTLQAGDLFVALRDVRDGHDFVPAAFKAGAAAALVSTGYSRQPGDGALIRVHDPLRGLERLGTAARARLSPAARVIAVTGSAGKTGTKEMLRAAFAALGRTHAPEKSYNNHWGVPLTLARMPADTQFGVFEIGMNHADEIRPLTTLVRPHVAIVTNVLPVHVGNFPDGEAGVARAKAEIFEGLEPGGAAVIPVDSPHAPTLTLAAKAAGARIVVFGANPDADVRLVEATEEDGGTTVRIQVGAGAPRIVYQLGMPGVHIAINSLAVAAALTALGFSDRLDGALAGLGGIHAPAGRGARLTLDIPGGQVLLIDESYNANPASVRAALSALTGLKSAAVTRKIAVLGDMLELGEGGRDYHLGLLDAASDCDLVYACGPNMRALFEALPADRQGHWTPTSAELAPHVLDRIAPGDAIMIKGSLGSRMGPIVDALKRKFAT